MLTNYDKGIVAERLVAKKYLKNGYRFLKHRYRNPDKYAGEVDLIFEHDETMSKTSFQTTFKTLVFVEVKFRYRQEFIREMISVKQIRRLNHARGSFMAENYDLYKDHGARLDIAFLPLLNYNAIQIFENITANLSDYYFQDW